MSKRVKTVVLFLIIGLSLCRAQQFTVKDHLTGKIFGSTPIYFQDNTEFISTQELVLLLSIPFHFNEQQKKIEFELNGDNVVVTAFSPFFAINDSIIQNLQSPLYKNEDIYLPIASFLTILNATDLSFTFQQEKQTILLPLLQPNILQIAFEGDSTQITAELLTSQSFQQQDIRIESSKQWNYVTINRGIFPARTDLKFELPDKVLDCIPIQLTPENARLSLRIDSGYEISDVLIENKSIIKLVITPVSTTPMFAIKDELDKEREKWKIDTIIIDPGHGGRDPGAVGVNGIYEKNITLAIAKMVKAELESRMNVAVVMTRNSDIFRPLQKRTEIANHAGGKLLLSIHVDANRAKWLRGHTVYFMGPAKTDEARQVAQKENSAIQFEDEQNQYLGFSDAAFILSANAQNSYNKESQELAAFISEEMTQECGSKSLGVRQALFYVLYGAAMPNILIETGFITNSADRRNLMSKNYQKRIAKSICDGVLRFKDHYESKAN